MEVKQRPILSTSFERRWKIEIFVVVLLLSFCNSRSSGAEIEFTAVLTNQMFGFPSLLIFLHKVRVVERRNVNLLFKESIHSAIGPIKG